VSSKQTDYLAALNVQQDYLLREFVELYEEGLLGRRDLLARAVGITGGAAAAAGTLLALGIPPLARAATLPAPLTQQAAEPQSPFHVPEDDPAVMAADITYPSGPDPILAYLARPAAAGRYPAVLICHENAGTGPHYRDVARRFAQQGYVALQPDLLSRQGGTDAVPPNERAGSFATTSPEVWVADFQAGMAYLRAQPFVLGDRIGMVGYCFGGGVTWNVAALEPTLRAAVPYYGIPSFIDRLAGTRVAALGIYGETDTRVNASIDRVRAALEQSGRPFEIKVYPDAGHAFFNDTRPSYREHAATAAWQDTLAWFAQHLRAGLPGLPATGGGPDEPAPSEG